MDRLTALAGHPRVNGVVVDLGSITHVHDLNVQADVNASCPYAKNLVASAIKNVIDAYRAGKPLQYIVIVGGDSVIPFFREPDQAAVRQEASSTRCWWTAVPPRPACA